MTEETFCLQAMIAKLCSQSYRVNNRISSLTGMAFNSRPESEETSFSEFIILLFPQAMQSKRRQTPTDETTFTVMLQLKAESFLLLEQ